MIFEQPQEMRTRLREVKELSDRWFKYAEIIPDINIEVLREKIPRILHEKQGVTFSDEFTDLKNAFNSLQKIIQSPRLITTDKQFKNNKDSKKHLARLAPDLAILARDLDRYIAEFNEGLRRYEEDIKAYDAETEKSKTTAPRIQDTRPSLFIFTHGVSLLEDKECPRKYEECESVLNLLKMTAAPLCMTFGSTASQDKFMPRFCIILDNWYKTLPQPRYNSIFDDPVMTVIMFNYVICAFYKEYKCNIFKNIPTELRSVVSVADNPENEYAIKKKFDDVIKAEIESQKGALFIYPISDAANYRRLPFDETMQEENLYKLLTTKRDRNSEEFKPGRVTIAYPPTDPPTDPTYYRNKIFVVDHTREAVSLDAICLNSFKFKFETSPDIIHVGAGESLFKILLDWYSLDLTDPDNPTYRHGNGPYASQLNKIIKEYDETYHASTSTEIDEDLHRGHDFSMSTSYSSIRIGPYNTITSMSLRFILFLFKCIGAWGINMADITCNCIDYDKDGKEYASGTEEPLQKLGPTQPSQERDDYFREIQEAARVEAARVEAARKAAEEAAEAARVEAAIKAAEESAEEARVEAARKAAEEARVEAASKRSKRKKIKTSKTSKSEEIITSKKIKDMNEEEDPTHMKVGGKRSMTASVSIKRKKNVTRSRRRIHRTRRRHNSKTKKRSVRKRTRKTYATTHGKHKNKSMRRRNK